MIDPLQFTLAVAILLATPGPTNTLLLTAAAAAGFRSLRLIPAEILGYLTTILAVGYVVAPWLTAYPWLALTLRLAVALYLCWLALRLWRSDIIAAQESPRLIGFRDVLVTTLLNPKALVFALGIIPLHEANGLAYLAAFVVMVMAIGSSWIGLGWALQRGLVGKRATHFVPRLAALAITGFAGYLLLPVWRTLAA